MNQSKQTTDGALLLACFLILLLIMIFIPFISLVGFFLIPVPFILYAAKYNWKPSLVMFGAALLLSMLFIPFISLPLSVYSGIGGIMIGVAIHQNLSPYETLARGTLGYAFGLLFVYLFAQLFLNVNLTHEFNLLIEESLEMSMSMLQSFGFDLQQLEEAQILMEDSFANILKLAPVILVVISMVIGLVSQWLGYKIINRIEQKKYHFPAFRTFKLPLTIIWFYIAALLVVLFDNSSDSTISMIANNVYTMIGLLIAIQGLSFIFFYVHFKKRSKALPITAIVLTIFLPPVLFSLFKIIGVIDLGFGLKKNLSQNKK